MPICKLCQQEKILKKSHIIPRFLYKFMQKNTNNQITQFNGFLNLWQLSNRQLIKEFFCDDCEQLLGKNETKFSSIFHTINKQKAEDRRPYCDPNKYPCLVDKKIYDFFKESPFHENIHIVKYFAISYIFRELLRNNYKIPDYYIDRLRNYLLNIEYFDFMIDIRLHNSPRSFNLFTTVIVMDGLEDWKHFAFYLPNMLFHIAFSIKDEIPNEFIEPIIFPDNLFCDEAGILKIVADLQKGAYKTKNFQPFCIQNSN